MSLFSAKRPILVTCPKALPPFLARETAALGLAGRELAAGVLTEGDMADCMRLNLHLRTGHRVLLELAKLTAPDPAALAEELGRLPWEDIIPADGHVTVDSSVQNEYVRDSRFANQKAKDAIVDRILSRMGRRPDSGPDPVGAAVFLHWRDDAATVYIDTTGAPLSRRGYRKMPHKAPLQETLAAGIVLATGFAENSGHFLSPMCGSGTLAIEAALVALNRAPGLLRAGFAFEHLLDFDAARYAELRREANQASRKQYAGRIIASDMDPEAVAAARQNARTAGVEGHIEFQVADFRESLVPEDGTGVCVLNPEYGARLGDTPRLEPIYAAIGDFFKQRLSGWRGFLFTGNPELAKRVGLKPRRRTPFFNAKIECRLLEYELYQGTRRVFTTPPANAR
ncbi:MAG: class I SAM-dependent RNA methyltransferase [Humidesulfovibrio sp.]|nr:class I SAM-dependent RNA methyltransferase [Humidesulfovibrio sp.]